MIRTLFILVTALSWGDKFDPFLGPEPIRPLIQQVCAEEGIPVHIAAGLLWSESGGHQFEVTGTSKGYWQLNALFHDDYAMRFYDGKDFDEFDPVASTIIALRYLAYLHNKAGTWWKALVLYKHGWATPASKAITALCELIANGGQQ